MPWSCHKTLRLDSADFVAGSEKTLSSLGYLIFAVILPKQSPLFENGKVGFRLYTVQAKSVSDSSLISGQAAETDNLRHRYSLIIHHKIAPLPSTVKEEAVKLV
jgi:hypothetical protein